MSAIDKMCLRVYNSLMQKSAQIGIISIIPVSLGA